MYVPGSSCVQVMRTEPDGVHLRFEEVSDDTLQRYVAIGHRSFSISRSSWSSFRSLASAVWRSH